MTLSIRTRNSLRAAGLHTPEQLHELLARNQPGKIPNIGKKSLNELRAWLAGSGRSAQGFCAGQTCLPNPQRSAP